MFKLYTRYFFLFFFILFQSANGLYAKVSSDTVYYNDSKRTIKSIIQKDGNKKHITTFHNNGTKSGEFIMENDTLNGNKKTWNYGGQILTEENYYKGLLNGTSKTYTAGGSLRAESNYVVIFKDKKQVSVKEGLQKEFFPSGKVRLQTYYKNGKKNGTETEWYESGIKKSEINYLDGFRYGKASYWNESGKQGWKGSYDTLNKVYSSGDRTQEVKSGLWESYYKTGDKESIENYIKGKKDGRCRQWYENGLKKSDIHYKQDRVYGLAIRWYSSGILQSRYTSYSEYSPSGKYQQPRYEGKYEEYDESGNPTKKGEYTKSGKKTGKWFVYSNGKIYEETEYKNGLKINDLITYHPDGSIHTIQKNKLFKEGNRDTSFIDGIYKAYFPDGKISEEGNYVKGQKKGIWKMYYSSGQIQQEVYMYDNNKRTSLKEYYEDGKLRIESDMYIDSSAADKKVSILPVRFYDKNGQLRKSISSFKGKAQGLFTQWGEEGNLSAEAYIFQGNEEYHTIGYLYNAWNVIYYSNGQLMKEMYTQRAQPVGVVVEWYINGKLKRVQEASVYDIQWTQTGDLINASFYSPNSNDEPKDTIVSQQWLKDIYIKYSAPVNKNISLQGNKQQGWVTSYYDDKQIRFETFIVNGKFDSIFKGYYPDGKLMVEWNLKKGIPHGRYLLINNNGTVRISGFYEEGAPYGVWKENSFYGIPYREYQYDSTDRDHKNYIYKKEYYETGALHSFSNYKNGKFYGLQQTWHSNGQLSGRWEVNIDGLQTGLSERFHSNGKMSDKKYYKEGKVDGREESWYDNGQKQSEKTYIDGQKQGLYKLWYKNGNLWQTGYYKNDQQDSTFIAYDSTGAINYESKYKDGVKIPSPLVGPCACRNPNEKVRYAQSVSSIINNEENIHKWEFPFHESIQKYIPKLFFRNLQANNGSYSMELLSYGLLEVGLPDKDGVKLVLNPCFEKGEASSIDFNAWFGRKNPDETRITLTPYMLALKFNKSLLVPNDKKLNECQAYFSVEYLSYSKSGVILEKPKAVCFPPSQIGNTGTSIELDDFMPVINLKNDSEARRQYTDLLPKETTTNFVGLVKGTGKISFPLQNINWNISLENFVAVKSFVSGNIVFDSVSVQGDKLVLMHKAGSITTTREDISKEFRDKGFTSFVTIIEESKKPKLIVKFIYQLK